MSDFLGKLIGVILVFTLMVLAPLTIWTFGTDLQNKRELMNETTNLIDKVTDSSVLSDVQLADFYLGCASHSVVVDAKVTRYMKVVSPDGAGGTVVSYVVADNLTTWNQGDIIKVTVLAIDYTGSQRLLMQIMNFFTDKISFSFSGMVR